MVDHIHLPKRVGPLFPTEKIKKVKRRKDKQQDSAFRENLEKEKKNSEGREDQDSYGSAQPSRQAGSSCGSKAPDPAPNAETDEEGKGREIPESEKRIDVHV